MLVKQASQLNGVSISQDILSLVNLQEEFVYPPAKGAFNEQSISALAEVLAESGLVCGHAGGADHSAAISARALYFNDSVGCWYRLGRAAGL